MTSLDGENYYMGHFPQNPSKLLLDDSEKDSQDGYNTLFLVDQRAKT